MNSILITGAAGFIGASLTVRLLRGQSPIRIVGLDNLNHYYDVELKRYRLKMIEQATGGRSEVSWSFIEGDISDRATVERVFAEYRPDTVIHLAAQAGVRYSIENPDVYIQSNIIGFYNMLEACRQEKGRVRHFAYASSSSVYGNNKKIPYSPTDMTDQPVSLYAATKKADEVMAYSYAKLYGISMTGMRFFTVYGPAGRPDMAYFSFADKLVSGKRIKLYNNGQNRRDFTYISDVVDAIEKIMARPPVPDGNGVCHKIYNIGNNHPVDVITFVRTLEQALKREKILPAEMCLDEYIDLVDAQPGDVELTYADIDDLQNDFGVRPGVTLDEGLGSFAKWYGAYMKHD